MNELHFILEVPVEPSKALRSWPTDLARLFIMHGPTRLKGHGAFHGWVGRLVWRRRLAGGRTAETAVPQSIVKYSTDDRLRFFAYWLKTLLLSESTKLYSCPLNILLSDRKLEEFMRRIQAGAGDAVPIKTPSDWLIECSGVDALLQIMRESCFERVVFWSDKDTEHARWIALEAGPNAEMEDGREDTPFLRFCTSVGGFVFYSFTHDNLEVIGTRDFIVRRCLPLITTHAIQ